MNRRFSPKRHRRKRERRVLQVETLERRQLLAGDTVLFADSFEIGTWNGQWVEDSQNDWFRSTQRATEGQVSAEVDGRAANATLTMTHPVDLENFETAAVNFSWFIEGSFDKREYVAVDFYNGAWQEVARLEGNRAAENTWHHESITLDSSQLTSAFKIRFRASVSGADEDANVDNVRIIGTPRVSEPIGLISHWTADGTAADAETGNDGTLVSGTAYTTGQMGQAFSFDGIDDRVLIPDSPSLLLTKSLTMEGWVRVDAFPEEEHAFILLRGDDRGGLDPYFLTTTSTGRLRFEVNSLTGGERLETDMPLGEFVYVAATLDDATGEMALYLNGVRMVQTITSTRPFGELDPTQNPGIGIGNHGGYPNSPHNFPFHGLIDELKIYDVPLSAEEILANFHAGKGSLQPSIRVEDAAVMEGQLNYAFVDDFVASRDGGLASPRGIAIGPDGNLYVASTDTDSVIRYDGATGEWIDEFVAPGSGGLDFPRDLEFHDGYLFVVSDQTHAVLRFDGATGAFIDQFIAPGAGGLEFPRGLLFGENNDLYVTSAGEDDAVLRYDATTGAFVEEFITSSAGGLDNPTRVAIGPDGNFYVSSTSPETEAILRYDPAGNFIDTFVTSGSGGLSGPTDLVFQSGFLYVASARSDSVLAYDAVTGAYVDAIVPSGSGGLDGPNSLLVDPAGKLYVSSRASHEILRYSHDAAALVTVRLAAPSPEVVTVDFSTADGTALAGSDYLATAGTITFAPGSTSQTIQIPIVHDAYVEPNEAFQVLLANASHGVIADATGVVTISDAAAASSASVVIFAEDAGHDDGAALATPRDESADDGRLTRDRTQLARRRSSKSNDATSAEKWWRNGAESTAKQVDEESHDYAPLVDEVFSAASERDLWSWEDLLGAVVG